MAMPELKPIIKFVNYKQTSPAKAKRLEAYISALGKTEKKLTASNYLTIGDAKRGLEVIYNRFHPNGQRLYKQGILAFGVPDIAVDTALNVAKDTLRFLMNILGLWRFILTNLKDFMHIFCSARSMCTRGKN